MRDHPTGCVDAARLIDQRLRAVDADQIDDPPDALDGDAVALAELARDCMSGVRGL